LKTIQLNFEDYPLM